MDKMDMADVPYFTGQMYEAQKAHAQGNDARVQQIVAGLVAEMDAPAASVRQWISNFRHANGW